MNLPSAADIVVIGAGLTGASTALHLAEHRPELEVVVLEAQCVAAGASGAGTGLLGPRLGPPIDVARRRDGDHIARQRHRDSVTAVDRVLTLAEKHAPGTVTPAAGQLMVATGAAQATALRRRAAVYATLGLDVVLTETNDPWATRTRTALAYHPAAGVAPGALTRGLVDAARAAGVQVLERTVVRDLEPGVAGWPVHVVTDRGAVLARAVVVAVDVAHRAGRLSDGLVGPDGQVPLQVSASATAELPPDLLAELGGVTAPHVISASALGPYRRITTEGRIVLGGGPAVPVTGSTASSRASAARQAWTWQRRQLDVLHPRLRGVPVTHRWSGRIGVTRDGLPRVGRLVVDAIGPDGEVWTAGGWNGHGLAATIDAGRRIADQVLTARRPDLPPARWLLGSSLARPLVLAALRLQTPSAPAESGRGSPIVLDVTRIRPPVPIREETTR
ncbi:MAG: FAD-binding oxidoreductase [Microlunatus sp.]|nr:FAD-binding oxidoreductase [Microlunatus sp.]